MLIQLMPYITGVAIGLMFLIVTTVWNSRANHYMVGIWYDRGGANLRRDRLLRNTPVYVSLLEELQLIRTLLDGIEHMATAAIATETVPSPESPLKKARSIREQLQSLSNEISENIDRST